MKFSQKTDFIMKRFLPFALGIFLISTISIRSLKNLNSNSESFQSDQTRKQLEKSYKHQLSLYTRNFVAYIEFLSKDKKVIELFKNRKRTELYEHLENINVHLSKNYNISHFYFHLPNRTVFLRLHQPNKHSDYISRFTLKRASQTKKMSSGIEHGLFNNLAFRVVVPLLEDDKVLGFIELGEDITHMSSSLIAMLPVEEVVITLNKATTPWYKGSGKYNLNLKYKIVVDSTLSEISENLKNIIDTTSSIKNKSISINKKTYQVNSVSLHNAQGQSLGEIFLLVDATDTKANFKSVLYNSGLLILIISFFILLTYYIYSIKIIGIANNDDMTGLYNKRYFNLYTKVQFEKSIKANNYLSLYIIDIDNFKKYNDNYGHPQGDEALKTVAKLLHEFFNRKDQMVYRVGGEEFAVLFPSKTSTESKKIAQRMIDKIYSEKIVHEHNMDYGYLTISVGAICKKLTSSDSIDALYAAADVALYKAKDNGRNQVVFDDATLS